MKKIMFLLLITVSTIIIYFTTRDNKQYVVVFGDYVCHNEQLNSSITNKIGNNVEKYVNNCQNDNEIVNLINKIENNEHINYQNEEYTMNNLLIKADTIIISIGMNDLLNYNQETNMYSHIDEVMIDMDKLLELVRYYSKEKIYIYNYFGLDNKYLKYVNKRLKELTKAYDIQTINIDSIKNKRKLNTKDQEIIINHTLNKIEI